MSSKPSVLYLHDVNGTHLVTPTSGHLSDGYANDDVVGSGELNAYWQNWGLWLQYLSQKTGLVARHVFTSSGTYTPSSASIDYVDVQAAGGGGGGGGVWVSGTAGYIGYACSGGNGGAFAGFRIPNVTAGGAVTVGAAGASGVAVSSNASGSGGNGGDTSLVLNASTLTFRGGVGGVGGSTAANSSNLDSITCGPRQSQSVNYATDFATAIAGTLAGALIAYGLGYGRGGVVQIVNGTGPLVGGSGGDGGSGPHGRGGQGQLNTGWFSTGPMNASGYGAGGGGAGLVVDASVSLGYSGGSGTAGIVVIDEYMNSL